MARKTKMGAHKPVRLRCDPRSRRTIWSWLLVAALTLAVLLIIRNADPNAFTGLVSTGLAASDESLLFTTSSGAACFLVLFVLSLLSVSIHTYALVAVSMRLLGMLWLAAVRVVASHSSRLAVRIHRERHEAACAEHHVCLVCRMRLLGHVQPLRCPVGAHFT